MRWISSVKGRLPASPAPVILMYHRIARAEMDPWGLAVSPENFQDQLRSLREKYDVLPLGDLARRHREGRLSPRSAAITFDDGYACNALVAAPMLASHSLPATFFLTTGMIGRSEEFWSDELERVVFDPTAGGSAEVNAGGKLIRIDLGRDTDQHEAIRSWVEFEQPRMLHQAIGQRIGRIWNSDTKKRSYRQSAYLTLWRELKPLGAEEQRRAIASLATQVGSTAAPRESHRPMTREEADKMASLDVVEIGGHTVTHASLPLWDRESQKREISGSIDACEDITGRPVTTFAYPYGDHSGITMEIAAARNVKVGCSTRALPVRRDAHPLALPRMQVLDWSGDRLLRMLGSHSRKH
jgi:peptidoglycan/xylan/chitin deacetylase (PgdA/CDA1 family)